MKVARIEIDGFRGFGRKQTLVLKGGNSLCLLAENGRGKSSIADALEFWSFGDVEWTHRDGIGLPALIHLDHTAAVVELKVEGAGVATRRLSGKTASPLIPGAGPLSTDFEPEGLPILRHRTIARFVDKSANDKRSELLQALGLTELSEFRRGVRSTAQKLKRAETEAIQQLLQAQRNLSEELEGEALPALLRKLSRDAFLSPGIGTEEDLRAWRPELKSLEPSGERRSTPLEELIDRLPSLQDRWPDEWAKATADRDAAEQRGLSVLLKAGRDVIADSEEDRCPLCLVEQDRRQLLQQVTVRATELASVDRKFQDAEAKVQEHELAVQGLIHALEAVRESGSSLPEGTEEDLASFRQELNDYANRVGEARRVRSALDGDPPKLANQTLEKLRREALSAPAGIGPAMLRLARLQGLVSAAARAESKAAETGGRLEAAEAAAEIADLHVERAVQQALDRINKPLAAYYSALVGKPSYSDLRLTYTEGRTGGIEFAFKWDGRKEVRPPQRVMSESELNALGLALFLARLKTDPPAWRAMVLDDVITSFDDVHDARLIRLLIGEFSDWQVLLLTHDQQLSRTVEAEGGPGWRNEKIVAWSTREGPSFGSGTMLGRLKERLDAGEPAAELGGLARQAMEEALERPLRKLQLKIRHDPQNVYSADEYRRALVDGLTDGGFQKADAPILQRLRSANSITNRACHFKDHIPDITAPDLRMLLDDLEELDELFTCESCGKKVWEITEQGSRHCRCTCGSLSCA